MTDAKSNDVNFNRVMQGHFKKSIKEKSEYIKYAMDPDNIKIIYVLIHNISGPKDEFIGGEFLFKMDAPKEFPFKPPSFIAYTPNGVYDVNKSVCISIGIYHSNDYRPALGISGFAQELANGLMCYNDLGTGINLIHNSTKPADKKKYAQESVAFNNKHYPQIMKMINEQYAAYSAAWVLPQVLAVKTAVITTPIITAITTAKHIHIDEKLNNIINIDNNLSVDKSAADKSSVDNALTDTSANITDDMLGLNDIDINLINDMIKSL